MLRRLVLLALALLGLVAVPALSAQAALPPDRCSPNQACGRVVNSIYSNANFTITNVIPAASGHLLALRPGQASSSMTNFRDADGFFVSASCSARISGTFSLTVAKGVGIWVYLYDGDNVAVIYTC